MSEPMTWSEYVRHTIGDDRQVDVAARTGIDQGTISRWLRADDRTNRPSVSSANVRAFARAYNRSVVEAFVVAGFLSTDDAEIAPPRRLDWRSVSNEELAAEVRRRLVHIAYA